MAMFLMVFDSKGKQAFKVRRSSQRAGWLKLASVSFSHYFPGFTQGKLRDYGKEVGFAAEFDELAVASIREWLYSKILSRAKLDYLGDDNAPRLQLTWEKIVFTDFSSDDIKMFHARFEAEAVSISYTDGSSKTAMANPGPGLFDWRA